MPNIESSSSKCVGLFGINSNIICELKNNNLEILNGFPIKKEIGGVISVLLKDVTNI